MYEISSFALRYLEKEYPERLKERYKIESFPEDIVELFNQIGKFRGCLMGGAEVDYDKVAELVIREIRMEKLGPLTFEKPSELLGKRSRQNQNQIK